LASAESIVPGPPIVARVALGGLASAVLGQPLDQPSLEGLKRRTRWHWDSLVGTASLTPRRRRGPSVLGDKTIKPPRRTRPG